MCIRDSRRTVNIFSLCIFSFYLISLCKIWLRYFPFQCNSILLFFGYSKIRFHIIQDILRGCRYHHWNIMFSCKFFRIGTLRGINYQRITSIKRIIRNVICSIRYIYSFQIFTVKKCFCFNISVLDVYKRQGTT